MSDEIPAIKDTELQPADDKEKRVHLLVQRSTHELLENLRIAMRRSGIGNVPPSIGKILEQDWTSDTLVQAGCAAIQHLLIRTSPEPATQPKKSGKR